MSQNVRLYAISFVVFKESSCCFHITSPSFVGCTNVCIHHLLLLCRMFRGFAVDGVSGGGGIQLFLLSESGYVFRFLLSPSLECPSRGVVDFLSHECVSRSPLSIIQSRVLSMIWNREWNQDNFLSLHYWCLARMIFPSLVVCGAFVVGFLGKAFSFFSEFHLVQDKSTENYQCLARLRWYQSIFVIKNFSLWLFILPTPSFL